MKKIFFITFCLFNFSLINTNNAQIKNSVYSMLGIGQLSDNSFGINRSLGGTGIAFKSGSSINYLNPASYLGMASKSHILEAGLYGMYTNSKTSSASENSEDINFDYLSIGFFLTDWWASSLGITPFSYIDYNINSTDMIEGALTTLEKKYEGSGGLNRLYFGNSFEVYKGLSVGVNLAYIVGPITQIEEAESEDGNTSYSLEHELTTSGFYIDYGIQYSIFDDNFTYTLGAIYGPEIKLNTSDDLNFVYNESTTALSQEYKETLRVPEKIGLGFAIERKDNYRIGFDYEWQKWSDIKFSNENFEAQNSNRFSLGIEYNPQESRKTSWLDNLTYRLGANYKNSYLEIDDTRISSYGVNLGLGIPYDLASVINLTLEYGREGTTNNGLIINNYLKFYVNISLHEFWSQSLSF